MFCKKYRNNDFFVTMKILGHIVMVVKRISLFKIQPEHYRLYLLQSPSEVDSVHLIISLFSEFFYVNEAFASYPYLLNQQAPDRAVHT